MLNYFVLPEQLRHCTCSVYSGTDSSQADNGTKEIEHQPSVLPPRASAQQSRSLGLLCDLGSATSALMQAELWRCSLSIKAVPNPPVTADRTCSQPVVSPGSLGSCRRARKEGSSLGLLLRAAEIP